MAEWFRRHPPDVPRPRTIYVLAHKVTGKMYVGQTVNLRRRMRQHAKKPPARMQDDILDDMRTRNDNGEAYIFEDLVSVATLEAHTMTQATANLLEKRHITDLGTLDKARGYNTLPGPPQLCYSYWAMIGRQNAALEMNLKTRLAIDYHFPM